MLEFDEGVYGNCVKGLKMKWKLKTEIKK